MLFIFTVFVYLLIIILTFKMFLYLTTLLYQIFAVLFYARKRSCYVQSIIYRTAIQILLSETMHRVIRSIKILRIFTILSYSQLNYTFLILATPISISISDNNQNHVTYSPNDSFSFLNPLHSKGFVSYYFSLFKSLYKIMLNISIRSVKISFSFLTHSFLSILYYCSYDLSLISITNLIFLFLKALFRLFPLSG